MVKNPPVITALSVVETAHIHRDGPMARRAATRITLLGPPLMKDATQVSDRLQTPHLPQQCAHIRNICPDTYLRLTSGQR